MGKAPKAAAFGEPRPNRIVAIALGLSGAPAGLAGMFELAGPAEQLAPSLPVGYGLAEIILANQGRLDPIGILPAGGVMALTHPGGENARFGLSLVRVVQPSG